MTGGPGGDEGDAVAALPQEVDGLEPRPGRQQCGLPRIRPGEGVQVEVAPSGQAELFKTLQVVRRVHTLKSDCVRPDRRHDLQLSPECGPDPRFPPSPHRSAWRRGACPRHGRCPFHPMARSRSALFECKRRLRAALNWPYAANAPIDSKSNTPKRNCDGRAVMAGSEHHGVYLSRNSSQHLG